MRLRIVVISIVLQSGIIPLRAQSFEEKDFTLLSIKDGLSDNRITSLEQDRYGYLWIATQKGLNRFDGYNFLQFYSDSSNSSLPSDGVKQLKWVGKDQLAASTGSGLHIISSQTLKEKNITVPPGALKQPYIENNVQGMAGDDAGNIFLLTSSGFYQFNTKHKLIFRYDHFKKEDAGKADAPFGRSDGIIMPRKDVLFLNTIVGPYIYYILKKELHPLNEKHYGLYQSTRPKWIYFMHSNSSSFSVIAENEKELVWFDLLQNKKYLIQTTLTGLDKLFGWRTKITKLNDTTCIITSLQKGFYLLRFFKKTNEWHILPKLYLPNYLCTSVFIDKQNRFWIGTSRGLLRQKKNSANLQKISLPTEMNPPGGAIDVRTITVANNKVFVGTVGRGIYVFDRNSLQFLKQLDLSKIGKSGTSNNVFTLVTLNKDSVYAGTYGPLIGIDTHNYNLKEVSLPHFGNNSWISWQFITSANMWLVTVNENKVFYYRSEGRKNFMLADYSNSPLFNILTPVFITEDPQGNIWFGGHGACRYNVNSHQFDLLLDSFPKIKIAGKQINGIGFDADGKIYFALVENGLAIYNPVQRTFEHITRSNGLPDNTIRALYLHKNKVWMGTESGVACYDISSKKVSSFGIADNMPEGVFTAYAFYYDSVQKQLYGGFSNSIVRFNPDSLLKNSSPPDFFIENINIPGGNVIYHPGDKLELSYKHNNIVVNLASVNFEDAFQQQFAYRFVKGGNDPWIETGSQRSVIFSNLSPGKHRLQVKVFIKNNSWPEQMREILIVVRPPFWLTTWFICSAVVSLLVLFYILFRSRIRSIRQKASIDRQLAELEMKGLHDQMNPHFIFNCLNSIKEMIWQDEKQNASRYLSKFAQLIRTNLEQSQQTFITVKQCIDHLQQYLEMEKIRFEEFIYSVDVQEDLPTDHLQMAPMLVQPLVENAIWHGLHSKPGNKKLHVRFYKFKEQLICEIEDNGIGYLQSLAHKSELLQQHHSLGIANIHERLSVLNEKYKMNCSLSITDKSELPEKKDSGTIACLKFSL